MYLLHDLDTKDPVATRTIFIMINNNDGFFLFYFY